MDWIEGARFQQAKQVGNCAHAVTECLSVIAVVVVDFDSLDAYKQRMAERLNWRKL